MSAGPSNATQSTSGASSKTEGRARHQANMRKYGNPLPILISSPKPNPSSSTILSSYLPTFLTTQTIIEIPICNGTYDPRTRSVWVTDKQDMEILFRRGFFGKGTLSRSEPTWRERRIDLIKGGQSAAAEKIREARRQERKQFKIDRAEAMLQAARAAEALLVGEKEGEVDDGDGDGDGEGDGDGHSSINIDTNTLNAQTFLVRPTRPDANRNRGRKAWKRKPAPTAPNPRPDVSQTTPVTVDVPMAAAALAQEVKDEENSGSEDEFHEPLVEEMEHLQLGLEESWFLSAALGVLRIHDPTTGTYPPVTSILPLFITPSSLPKPLLLPDDPFLVSYAAYHHYRSLGWVVKSGIKFCCDWLLYRRGPVFSHAAFSMVLVPVYADPSDREKSPYGHEDWYEEKMSWKWMNTVMRVNSLVQKTVILVYVTIPALSSFPTASQTVNGGLDPHKNGMASLLPRYNIREVVLQRFGPARRRD